jgi:hypothetical protein
VLPADWVEPYTTRCHALFLGGYLLTVGWRAGHYLFLDFSSHRVRGIAVGPVARMLTKLAETAPNLPRNVALKRARFELIHFLCVGLSLATVS